jgi:molecular chaperone HtpG
MSSEATPQMQEFEYKAEMKQLLSLIIHSLYTNHEIFLRELVSNASDALNKIRFRRLTDSKVLSPESELVIKITANKDENTFTIEDTGIGMTREDLVDRLGTIASSGTMEFLSNLKNEGKSFDANMIGRFGVGFYSVFMVTDEITVETRNAEPDSKAYRWKSTGEDKFSIEEIEKAERGTKITFSLKDEYKEFYEPYRIKNILKKYSNFVDFPIYVNDEKVNTVNALWHKKKDDISEEELKDFYKFISNDFQDPLGHIHFSIEGNVNFKSLLFIPQTAPQFLFRDTLDKNLQLYSSRIFIQDDCKELLPDYLAFVKGVVDTEDLPLNVSREVTQNSPLMAKMKSIIVGRVLSLLEEWAENDKEKYNIFYKTFGSLFKTGYNGDYANKDKILNLLRFESNKTEKGELTSFKEYSGRMKDGQTEIYYISGEHRDLIEKRPNLEYFKKNDIEVIFLSDPTDIFIFPYIFEFDKKPLKSIDKDDINLDSSSAEKTEEGLDENSAQKLLLTFKDELGDKVEDVVISKRLVESPATLVVSKTGMDPHMEKYMSLIDKNYAYSKKILEINISHPLIINLSKLNTSDSFDDTLRKSINQVFEGTLLQEGQLTSYADFVKRMNELLVKATEK